jgi:hypothetical protein
MTVKIIFQIGALLMIIVLSHEMFMAWTKPESIRSAELRHIEFQKTPYLLWPWKQPLPELRQKWVNSPWWIWYRRLINIPVILLLLLFLFLTTR